MKHRIKTKTCVDLLSSMPYL